MWSLLRKEVREHLVICIAALSLNSVALGLFVVRQDEPNASAISQVAREIMPRPCGAPPLVDWTLLAIVSVGGGAYGAALGLLQTLTESITGTYPFLVHRPISRSGIVLGKIGSGLFLYATPTLVPFAAVVWWASRPGSYAGPFEMGMAGMGLLGIAYGFIFYLGGMLVGLSPARWYTTRVAGLVAPVVGIPLVTDGSASAAILTLFVSASVLLWANLAMAEQRPF